MGNEPVIKTDKLRQKLILIALIEAERPITLLDLFPITPRFFKRWWNYVSGKKRKPSYSKQ